MCLRGIVSNNRKPQYSANNKYDFGIFPSRACFKLVGKNIYHGSLFSRFLLCLRLFYFVSFLHPNIVKINDTTSKVARSSGKIRIRVKWLGLLNGRLKTRVKISCDLTDYWKISIFFFDSLSYFYMGFYKVIHNVC